MKPPLKIQFTGELKNSIERNKTGPPDSALVIPFAAMSYVTSDFGEVIFQSINGGDYWIEFLSISLLQDSYINLNIENTFFCIAIMLDGAIPDQMVGKGLLNLPAASYNMFCLPVGVHRINLLKGIYTILFIVPAFSDLSKMAAEHSGLQYLISMVEQKGKNGVMLESFEFPFQIRGIIDEMKNCKQKGASLDLTLRSYMLKILSLYNDQLTAKLTGHLYSSKEKAFKLRDYILLNLENPGLGGLHELSELFHITPKTLTRVFQSLFQKTVPEYIREERMRWAYYLLTHTYLSIQEISEKTGYSYQAHFTRDFKIRYGVSPINFKNKKDDLDIQ